MNQEQLKYHAAFELYTRAKVEGLRNNADFIERVMPHLPKDVDAQYVAIEQWHNEYGTHSQGLVAITVENIEQALKLREAFPPMDLGFQIFSAPAYVPQIVGGVAIKPIVYQVLNKPLNYSGIAYSNCLFWYTRFPTLDDVIITVALPVSHVRIVAETMTLEGVPDGQKYTLTGDSATNQFFYGFAHWEDNDDEWESKLLAIGKGEYAEQWDDVIDA